MKRVLAISLLFVFLIAYITPITSVHATEVTWGDNNSYYLTDEEFYTARQLATLEIIPQLTGNGVNELSIDNAESVDDWIVNFLEFIDNNAESAISDIYSTCVDIKNEIDNTANRIGQELKSFGTDLNNAFGEISDWFDTITGVKSTYLTNPTFIKDFNRLSRFSSSTPTPSPDPEFSFLANTVDFKWFGTNYDTIASGKLIQNTKYNWAPTTISPINYSFVTFANNASFVGNPSSLNIVVTNIGSIYITDLGGNNVTCSYSNFNLGWNVGGNYYVKYCQSGGTNGNNLRVYDVDSVSGNNFSGQGFQTSFAGLSTCCNYINQRFRHVNIYYNGEPWVIVNNDTPQSIILDINGIEFYGNENKQPIQYFYPQGTQIDYKKLYLVIKQAIEDSLPISQTTINQGDVYYDNSNNVYAPVIYNYYSDDESESDVINDVLSLAIIPKFDTALLGPIEEPITNGTVIMTTGVQALPNDILLVIGAGFVLILFGAFINRLIE